MISKKRRKLIIFSTITILSSPSSNGREIYTASFNSYTLTLHVQLLKVDMLNL